MQVGADLSEHLPLHANANASHCTTVPPPAILSRAAHSMCSSGAPCSTTWPSASRRITTAPPRKRRSSAGNRQRTWTARKSPRKQEGPAPSSSSKMRRGYLRRIETGRRRRRGLPRPARLPSLHLCHARPSGSPPPGSRQSGWGRRAEAAENRAALHSTDPLCQRSHFFKMSQKLKLSPVSAHGLPQTCPWD